MNSAQETAIYRKPPVHSFAGDSKKLDRSSTDQDLSMFRFYENIRTKIFFCGHNILTEGVFVTQLSSNA
jgi:hypothetical protein